MKSYTSSLQIGTLPVLQFSGVSNIENSFKALRGGKASSTITLHNKENKGQVQPVFTVFPYQENDLSETGFLVSKTNTITESKTDLKPGLTTRFLQKSFFDQTASMTWFVDEDNHLIHANPALLHFLGIEKKDLNKKVTEIVPEFIREKFFKAHLSVRASGIPCKKVLVQPMANGTNNYFLINIYPFTNRYNKNLLVGEAFDITFSFQAQEEMSKANERLINLSKVTTEAIWEWDIETGYVFRNDRLTRLVGSNEDAFDSYWWYDLIHPEDRQRVKNKLENTLKEKKSTWEHEFRMMNINGNYITLHEQGFIIYRNDEAAKMIGSLRDITEVKVLESRLVEGKIKQQKRLTEAMVRAQEKERIRLGNELHDNVNQLLAASKLFLDLVKTADAESNEFKTKVSQYIETACTEIRNLSHGLVVANFDQGGLIGSFNKILNDLTLSTTYKITFKYDEKIESLNKSKKINLLRILQEQIKNIIKHSKATKIEVELNVINNKAQLLIKDNGIGFDPNICCRGIGLSNIYDRAKLNNGSVELNASPGMGCGLKVIIPVKNK